MSTISREDIAKAAGLEGVPADVLAGVLGTEHSFRTDSLTRFEPGVYSGMSETGKYKEWYTPNDKERRDRATSWGVGHVMGYRLRALGFSGSFESLLTDHLTAARYAAKALRQDYLTALRLKAKYPDRFAQGKNSWENAVAVYNTGDASPWPVDHINRYRGWLARYVGLLASPPAIAALVCLAISLLMIGRE